MGHETARERDESGLINFVYDNMFVYLYVRKVIKTLG